MQRGYKHQGVKKPNPALMLALLLSGIWFRPLAAQSPAVPEFLPYQMPSEQLAMAKRDAYRALQMHLDKLHQHTAHDNSTLEISPQFLDSAELTTDEKFEIYFLIYQLRRTQQQEALQQIATLQAELTKQNPDVNENKQWQSYLQSLHNYYQLMALYEWQQLLQSYTTWCELNADAAGLTSLGSAAIAAPLTWISFKYYMPRMFRYALAMDLDELMATQLRTKPAALSKILSDLTTRTQDVRNVNMISAYKAQFDRHAQSIHTSLERYSALIEKARAPEPIRQSLTALLETYKPDSVAMTQLLHDTTAFKKAITIPPWRAMDITALAAAEATRVERAALVAHLSEDVQALERLKFVHQVPKYGWRQGVLDLGYWCTGAAFTGLAMLSAWNYFKYNRAAEYKENHDPDLAAARAAYNQLQPEIYTMDSVGDLLHTATMHLQQMQQMLVGQRSDAAPLLAEQPALLHPCVVAQDYSDYLAYFLPQFR